VHITPRNSCYLWMPKTQKLGRWQVVFIVQVYVIASQLYFYSIKTACYRHPFARWNQEILSWWNILIPRYLPFGRWGGTGTCGLSTFGRDERRFWEKSCLRWKPCRGTVYSERSTVCSPRRPMKSEHRNIRNEFTKGAIVRLHCSLTLASAP